MLERSYSPKEAAAILGVTVHTIQVWDRQGKMHCLRLPSGRRSIPESEVRRLLSLKQRRVFVIYARVSSYDQREYLGRQIERLKKMVPEAVV
jgi:putative resolvase